MDAIKIIEVMPDELRHYLARTPEGRYVLIDVRQPEEYAVAHIPGATLLPLLQLEERLFELPADRELVFYCHSGARSEIAAALAAEAELSELPIYLLIGGMLAWDGQKIDNFPRVQVFDRTRRLPELLMAAMNLEKGAFRYYRALLDLFEAFPFRPEIDGLSQAEEDHARMIYALWKPHQKAPQPFTALFADLPGDILEGGEALEEVLARLRAMPSDTVIQVLEFSLRIEYRAYDLYRSLAEGTSDAHVRDSLLTIAQAEKSHMRRLQEAIAECARTVS
jgi:rhodanese-related sulfurtransferase/rubrerythrin